MPVRIDVSRTTGNGWALRLRFAASLRRARACAAWSPPTPRIEVDAREVSQPGGGEELQSPYVADDGELDLAAWARDALVLALPAQIVCRADCAGLCPQCGATSTRTPSTPTSPRRTRRWAKLSEIRFD